jgi:hypothetical protein
MHQQKYPASVYADQHAIFQNSSQPSLKQGLSGELPRTQVGRLIDALGIQLIPARSPQAKGRIERLWGTLQDRSISVDALSFHGFILHPVVDFAKRLILMFEFMSGHQVLVGCLTNWRHLRHNRP